MNAATFKDMPKDVSPKKIADCPLGKMADGKAFDKPMSEYDKPLGSIVEDELKKKAAEVSGADKYRPDTDRDGDWPFPLPPIDPRQYHMPIEGNDGNWDDPDNRGDSTWRPDREVVPIKSNPEGKTWGEILDEYGIDGIPFKDGEPDFSEVSKGEVEIEPFSTERSDNFDKADAELAKQRGCTPEEVAKWRKENGYTWHECKDMKTMQKVPSKIHNNVPHSGGISEAKKKEGA